MVFSIPPDCIFPKGFAPGGFLTGVTFSSGFSVSDSSSENRYDIAPLRLEPSSSLLLSHLDFVVEDNFPELLKAIFIFAWLCSATDAPDVDLPPCLGFFTGEGPGTTGLSLPELLITFFFSFFSRLTCLSTLLFSLLMAEGDSNAVLALIGSSASLVGVFVASLVGVLVGVLDGAFVLFGVLSLASAECED